MKRLLLIGSLAALLIGCAERLTPEQRTGRVDSDNTAVNTRDQHATAKTPINQNENQRDIDITATIRRRVVDGNMSINAANVKIITQDGKVTLRGPVKNQAEKDTINAIAVDVAGNGNVENLLEVEANP